MSKQHKKHGKKDKKEHKKKKCSSSSNSSTGSSTSWSEHKKKIKPLHFRKHCVKRWHCSKFKKDHSSCTERV